jgi:hypothetical protein
MRSGVASNADERASELSAELRLFLDINTKFASTLLQGAELIVDKVSLSHALHVPSFKAYNDQEGGYFCKLEGLPNVRKSLESLLKCLAVRFHTRLRTSRSPHCALCNGTREPSATSTPEFSALILNLWHTNFSKVTCKQIWYLVQDI